MTKEELITYATDAGDGLGARRWRLKKLTEAAVENLEQTATGASVDARQVALAGAKRECGSIGWTIAWWVFRLFVLPVILEWWNSR